MTQPMPKRVLFLGRQFYPGIGGTEVAMLELGRGLIQRGWEVSVLTLNEEFTTGEKLAREDQIDGIQIHRIPYTGPRFKPIPLCKPGKIAQIFNQFPILHSHDLRFLWEWSLWSQWASGKSFVLNTNGFILYQKKFHWLKRLFFRHYYLPTFKRVDSVIASSGQDFEKLKGKITRLTRMDLGVDYKKFSQVKRNPVRGELLYLGRIDWHKGVDALFRVLAQCEKPYRLTLVYGSAERSCLEALKEKAKVLGIDSKLRWKFKLPFHELINEFSKAQFAMLPSQYEGFGLTTLEEMAAGVVPIANQIDAFENIITDQKNGYLVDFTQFESLAKKLDDLYDQSESEATQMSEAARERAQEFDWSHRARFLDELYSGLLERKPRGG